jgi:phosphatidyl-myo-inositol alpha-mannosyltransferase
MGIMKIGIVCPYNMFTYAGGVQEIVINLQKQLNARGHNVKIITPRPRDHSQDAASGYILVGRSTKMNTPFNTMADIGFEVSGDEIEAVLEKEQFDLLNFHEPWVPILSRQILSRSNAINVGTFHAKIPESLFSKSFMNTVGPYTKSILSYIHSFTAVSEAAAEHLRTLTKDHIEIVPNGIELSNFEGLNKQNSAKKSILYLGRLEKRKGVEYLISAFAKLRQDFDNVELIIAGNGVKSDYLKRVVDQYEVPDVSFIGFVPEEKKAQLMADADVFCSPAIYGESFGIVLLEAMAVGTPVVAGNNSGYASVMTGKGRLSLVTPQSTEDFAHKLELMLFDEEVRNIWLDWAKNEVKKYDFTVIADKYEQAYQKSFKIHA